MSKQKKYSLANQYISTIIYNKNAGYDIIKEKEMKLPSLCILSNESKYKSRGSPAYPANTCPMTLIFGNDEEPYLSTPDKNGVYHWKRYKSMEDTKNAFEYYEQFPFFEHKYDYKEIISKCVKIKKELAKDVIPFFDRYWQNPYVYTEIRDIWDNIDDNYLDKINKYIFKKVKKDNLKLIDNDIYGAISSYVYYSDWELFMTSCDKGIINVHYHAFELNTQIKKEHDEKIVELFKKYFPNRIKIYKDRLTINLLKK